MTAAPQLERRRAGSARRRVLDTATRLFYAEGIRAVGIDRIIAEAGVAKATFYHHFPAKDDLVRTYVEEQSRLQRDHFARMPRAEPREALLTVFARIGEAGGDPHFRGCVFLNAAAEYPDAGHPVRRAVDDHRRWFHGLLAGLLEAGGDPDAARTADILVALRDGLVVGAHLDDPHRVRALIGDAVTRVLDGPRPTGRPGGAIP
ncbi:DNA-binding transcriptional regulator, AcrR family [Thermomonospora echinospora]|uniref:DNA-binding transcriptional regulator, AcrR family n=1 Tax=Thermomonospora echinospora TaxID=1992 RepID=A0A1H5XNC4_9ACTN|nr:TetR/AcrR family transcriptional regulator [Thermomonospora echinospora]SEG13192.1 DNA-binding transcriptional regulator, AcrR family [Thermomonospora echinospora]